MPTDAEFEEKEYEQPLYEELAFAPGHTWTPGQVLAHGGAPVPDPPPDPDELLPHDVSFEDAPSPAPPGAVRSASTHPRRSVARAVAPCRH